MDTPFGNEAALAQTTVTVSDDGSEFEFRIPSILDEVKIGARMRRLRLAADPMDDPGSPIDLDTMAYLKSMAYFEVLLEASNASWAWVMGPQGKMVVDSTKFPPNKVNQVIRVASEAIGQVNRFRAGTTANRGTPGNEAVAG